MFKPLYSLAVAGAVLPLSCLGAAPALALSPVTFVSGKGTDSGTCASPASPCRTFQFALGQTVANGEIKALDPANYGPVTIAKSVSITGVEGAGIDRGTAGVAITINAVPNDRINLSHLTLDGLRIASLGILLNSGGSSTIAHCVVRNFAQGGILLGPTNSTRFLIGETLVSNNANAGINVVPLGAGSAQGTLDHVSMNNNGGGTHVDGRGTSGEVHVTAVESMATNNGIGFQAQNRAILRLARSAVTENNFGVLGGGLGGGTVESFGDNDIHGNTFGDVVGNLTPVATR